MNSSPNPSPQPTADPRRLSGKVDELETLLSSRDAEVVRLETREAELRQSEAKAREEAAREMAAAQARAREAARSAEEVHQ